jgi:SAM-dependent methyltransferase
MRMPSPAEALTARVRAQYEAFPYPAYGLWLPLRGQEAYASNSLFAARLLEQRGREPALRGAPAPRILLAGCGDVFPYLATCWEPRRHRLIAADLSARSLRRARLRCLPRLRELEWMRGDLADGSFPLPSDLAHFDCFGVLHHTPRPSAILRRLGTLLAPGGTARIMVYNSAARGWIRHLQKAFALSGLSGADAADREEARRLLAIAAGASPALRDRLAPMRDAFARPARFIDTFFHAREARLDLGYWLDAIADAGLEAIGLFDRYGELDDLPNPLLEMPEAGALAARIADRRFEGNLELFLAKPGPPRGTNPGTARGAAGATAPIRLPLGMPSRLPSAHALRSPPAAWRGYRETCKLPLGLRMAAWRHFLSNLSGEPRQADAWAARMPPEACARLARLGVILPDECASRELREILRMPLEAAMEPPDFPAPADLGKHRELRERVEALLRGKPGAERRIGLVLARLDAAQKP